MAKYLIGFILMISLFAFHGCEGQRGESIVGPSGLPGTPGPPGPPGDLGVNGKACANFDFNSPEHLVLLKDFIKRFVEEDCRWLSPKTHRIECDPQ